jgi:hypothetical protein
MLDLDVTDASGFCRMKSVNGVAPIHLSGKDRPCYNQTDTGDCEAPVDREPESLIEYAARS